MRQLPPDAIVCDVVASMDDRADHELVGVLWWRNLGLMALGNALLEIGHRRRRYYYGYYY